MTPIGEAFLRGLAQASLAATGLILVILACRRWSQGSPGRWRMALWTILVLRMATAWAPMPTLAVAVPVGKVASVASPTRGASAQSLPKPPQPPAPASRVEKPIRWMTLLLVLWGLGAASLLLWLLQGNLRLWWAVRKGRVLTRQSVLDLLERCKDELGVRTVLGIVVTERVPSPSLFGFVRPRLLLPPQVLETLSVEELRHVFLHELAHLQRWDLLASWACALLQVVHWFNPLVWLAFRRMRADRELACDQVALWSLPSSERGDYGRTLIKLLELLAPPVMLPSLAGVVEEAGTFTWRIKMITRSVNATRRPRWNPLSLGLVGAFTLAAFAFSFSAHGQATLPPLLAHPLQDEVDYPFVDDPDVVGTWRVQDFVLRPEAFTPGNVSPGTQAILERWAKEMPFMVPFSVRPGGGTSSGLTWTKGLFLNHHEVERTASHYEVKTLDGTDYLLMEFKNGDYTYRGMPPKYVVFRRESRIPVPPSRIVDKVDFPFVPDPALLGTWHSVDFVRDPEDFQPGKPDAPVKDLYLKGLSFLPEGKTDSSYTWTEGLILHLGNKTAARYTIRQLAGHPYLFMEWKSGDYTLRGMKPQYYVMTK